MRIVLATVYGRNGCTLKDVAGGFGTHFSIGRSLGARLLAAAKGHMARLPPASHGHLAALLRARGHDVVIADLGASESPPAADLVLVQSSLSDAPAERALGIRLAGATRVVFFGASWPNGAKGATCAKLRPSRRCCARWRR